MEYIIGSSILFSLGYDFILRTLSRTTDNIFMLLTNIHTNKECKNIKDLDLEIQLICIKNAILYYINKNHIHVNSENKKPLQFEKLEKQMSVSPSLISDFHSLEIQNENLNNLIDNGTVLKKNQNISIECDSLQNLNDENHIQTTTYSINNVTKEFYLNPIISGIQNNLMIIENELKQIHNKIEYNKRVWFSYLFAKSFDNHIDIIIEQKKILDKRFDLFIKLVNI